MSSLGAVVLLPGARRSFCIASVAAQLDVSKDWVKDHLHEFPNRYRLPGGGQNGGEWRIPAKDLDAFEERRGLCQ